MDSYARLEEDYVATTGGKPKISVGGNEDGLNAQNPAQTLPNDEIKIWDELRGEELVEAKAHEVGHIILRYNGLVAFDIADKHESELACGDAANDLCMEINNAISHRYLFQKLKHDYQIDSLLQRKARCQCLEDIAQYLSELQGHTVRYHIEGIIAYDILHCDFLEKEQVELVLNIDSEIRKAFELSLQHLAKIYIGQPIEEQIQISKQFLDELGYPPKVFKIMEPFPLLKQEHRDLLNVGLTSQPAKMALRLPPAAIRKIEKLLSAKK